MAIDPEGLQVGQTVAVRDFHFGLHLTPVTGGEGGLTVREVGPEHLVLSDPASGSRIQIPRYLILPSPPAPEGGRGAA
jgi:hypothetical protein